jgi:hypothetical protein
MRHGFGLFALFAGTLVAVGCDPAKPPPPVGNGLPFTISEGKVRPTETQGASSNPEVVIRFVAAPTVGAADQYFVMVRSHYAMNTSGREAKLPAAAVATGQFNGRIEGGGMPEAPYDIWIEQRSGGGKAKVSNTFTVQE